MQINRDKRNPNIERSDGETDREYLPRIAEYISKLEWQSDGHRMWYTHKNPYSCWICELLQAVRSLYDIAVSQRDDTRTDEDGYIEPVDDEETDLNNTKSYEL